MQGFSATTTCGETSNSWLPCCARSKPPQKSFIESSSHLRKENHLRWPAWLNVPALAAKKLKGGKELSLRSKQGGERLDPRLSCGACDIILVRVRCETTVWRRINMTRKCGKASEERKKRPRADDGRCSISSPGSETVAYTTASSTVAMSGEVRGKSALGQASCATDTSAWQGWPTYRRVLPATSH